MRPPQAAVATMNRGRRRWQSRNYRPGCYFEGLQPLALPGGSFFVRDCLLTSLSLIPSFVIGQTVMTATWPMK